MLQQDPLVSQEPGWKELVGISGPDGEAWLEHYQQPHLLRLEKLGIEALLALRQGLFEQGRELLRELEEGLDGLDGVPASVRQIHDRWYFGVLAYYEYQVGHPEQAEATLQAAYDAVRAAIEESPFLILLANHCQEFRLHQARIARSRRDWKEVRRYIAEAASMSDGKTPLCVLPSGKPIYLADMKAFCEALPRPEGAPPFFSSLFDEQRHRQLFEGFVEGIYLLPGFVLAYN